MNVNVRPLIGTIAALILLAASPCSAVSLNYLESWCGSWDHPTRIVCDSVDHLIYVTCPDAGKVMVFNPDGTVNREIAGLTRPGAIAIDRHAALVVSELGTVSKRALDGSPVLTVGFNNYFSDPHDIVTTPDGRIYVSDGDNHIESFDESGTPLLSFGSSGWFNGRMFGPVAMALDPQTLELAVCDQNNYRVQLFSLAGDSLEQWGSLGNGQLTPGQFLRPWGLDIDRQGRIWVFDELQNMLHVFNRDGDVLFACLPDRVQRRGGVDIAIDGDRLYLTSPSTNCIEVYLIDELGLLRGGHSLNLTISVTGGIVRLNWTAVPLASGYHVYRSSSLDFPLDATDDLGRVTALEFTDRTATAAAAVHYFYVTAEFEEHSGTVDGPRESGGMEQIDLSAAQDLIDRNHSTPHHVSHGVNCTSCHFPAYDHPDPLPEWWFGDVLCKGCHVETAMGRPEQNHVGQDTTYCTTCHNPHFHQPQFARYFVNDVIETPQGNREVHFNNATDFVHGAPGYDGICEICHTQTAYHRNTAAGNHTHNNGTNCLTCHPHEQGFMPSGGACNSCHGAPPATAAHMVHVGMPEQGVGYGDLRQTSDFAANATVYNFGCGNCHPADGSHHRNGQVDIELYNPAAPPLTLKSKNPSTAAYTPGPTPFTDEHGLQYTHGTCSNVYCHSSGQSEALRSYATPGWGDAQLGCNGCHGEPPTYSSTGAGIDGANSHYQFGLYFGYADIGHVLGIHWGHDSTTVADSLGTVINCTTCHYTTTASNRNVAFDQGDADCSNCHDALTDPPMYNRGTIGNTAAHVSGSAEISFTPEPFRSVYHSASSAPSHGWVDHPTYDETWLNPVSGYDPDTKTCSNVPCHLDQTTVQWGYWGTDYNAGCECHVMVANDRVPEHRSRLDSQRCTECHGNLMRHVRD